MITVDYSHVTEVEPNAFHTEASCIELDPGQWPITIPTRMGNGEPLRRYRTIYEGGELIGVLYVQDFGCVRVTVAND